MGANHQVAITQGPWKFLTLMGGNFIIYNCFPLQYIISVVLFSLLLAVAVVVIFDAISTLIAAVPRLEMKEAGDE